MSYVKKTVSINGTELDFMKAFIKELTAADDRIVCVSDENAIKNAIENGGADIYIKINDSCKIKFYRSGAAADNSYSTSIIVNNKEYNKTSIHYKSSIIFRDSIDTRAFNFSVVSNDNVIFISIGEYDNYSIPTQKLFILSINNDNFAASGSSTSLSSLKTLICTDPINIGQTILFINRLAYQNNEISITDNIDSKILTYGSSNTKFAEVTGLTDCSYMTYPSVISTNSGRCFVLNNYTLIPIKE